MITTSPVLGATQKYVLAAPLQPYSPAAGSGLGGTYFWVAPKTGLVVIILQQVEPFNISLQLALKPAIYAAVEE